MKRSTFLPALLVVAVVATGCVGHALSQPMPMKGGRLALTVTGEEPSKMDEMPSGVHQLPGSRVYISGHQSEPSRVSRAVSNGLAILVGLPSYIAAAEHAADQSTGEKKIQGAQEHLKIDLGAALQTMLDEERARRADAVRFAPAGTTGDLTLEVAPFAVLTFIGDDKVRPWIVLKTKLVNAKGDEKWKTRYIAGVRETRTIAGDGGWVAESGQPLRVALDRAMRAAVDVLLREASGQLTRGSGKRAKVKGNWVWVKPALEMPCEILDDRGDVVVVLPKTTDAVVFAGVNIFDKESVTVTPEPAK